MSCRCAGVPRRSRPIGVQDRDQRHLRPVRSLTEQVDADEHIEAPESRVAHDLHALNCIDICTYRTRTPTWARSRPDLRMGLVSVATSTRSRRFSRMLMSASRSSICPVADRTSTGEPSRSVGGWAVRRRCRDFANSWRPASPIAAWMRKTLDRAASVRPRGCSLE